MLLNFQEKTEKVHNVLKNWQYRRLSLLGKITISKSLVASQLVNVFSPLQTNHQAIKELNEVFYHFLWDGKPDKIKRNIVINKYSDGGLKMIDLLSFKKSLKTIWIKKYLDKTTMGKRKLFFHLELGRYGGILMAVFLGNLDKKDTKNHFHTSDIFVNEILLIWAEVNFNNSISSLEQYKTQMTIDRKPVFFFSRMACQRKFDSRVSYKRRDLFPLLYGVFKQISLQELPTYFQWDYCNFEDNKDEMQGKYRQSGNC